MITLRSDTFQVFVMIAGILACAIKGTMEFPGGLNEIFRINYQFKKFDIFK